ncbi:MAG: aminoacyl-tRNA synthetase [Burkholderiales bacterium]|nr:aminoacyl-tRNA synthetase [Burkholderiales bacterium]
MRMSDEEYFRSCVARERQLAHLLGHSNIEECYESAGTLWENTAPLPKWTRDWQACGPLMVAYGITLSYAQDSVSARAATTAAAPATVYFSEHPSKDKAVMYAIVKAVILVLEHAKTAQ